MRSLPSPSTHTTFQTILHTLLPYLGRYNILYSLLFQILYLFYLVHHIFLVYRRNIHYYHLVHHLPWQLILETQNMTSDEARPVMNNALI